MNKSLLATLAATALLSTIPVSAPVEATSAIQRCQSSDGSLVYTDKACAIFGAKAAPIPGQLLTRIARDERMHPSTSTDTQYADATTPLDASSSSPVSRRSPTSGCARTPTQLAMDLRGSLALGDVNRVAESYYWVGMSNKQGQKTLDRLQHLLGKSVVDSHYYDAQIMPSQIMASPIMASPTTDGEGASWMAAADTPRGGGNAGILQLALQDDAQTSVMDLDVQRYAGCYFVSF